MNKKNFNRIIIRIVSVIEILIGSSISLSFIIASLITPPGRPKTVYGFVVATSLISVIIGIGLFRYKEWGRRILIFFAGYVIVTKFLLVTHLVTFIGNTIEFMSIQAKDILSLIYHIVILIVFNLKSIKSELNHDGV